jgi:Zn ribbon nucleic-acid-binding protein
MTYRSMILDHIITEDVVSPDAVCPECYEKRTDWLVWDEDGELVTCARCGCVYDPAEVA